MLASLKERSNDGLYVLGKLEGKNKDEQNVGKLERKIYGIYVC